MKYLLSTLLTIITGASAFGQAFVVSTNSFQPTASGNSVWITKTGPGQPIGSVYALGWSPGFLNAVEYFSLGGERFNWRFTGGQLYFSPNGTMPPLVNGLYLCPPPGPNKALMIEPVIGAATASLGAFTVHTGQAIVIPLPGAEFGTIYLPGVITSQIRFRVITR